MSDVLERLRDWWDADARSYDDSASHSLGDPVEAACWAAALRRHLPEQPASVLDVGTGTGALALLAARMGHRVTALDLSPQMLARARAKAEASGLPVRTVAGAATDPPAGPFDAVIERHLLWTTPDPVAALSAWRGVAPRGRLVLFESVVGRNRPIDRWRDQLADGLRRLGGKGHDHHAPYDPEVMASLPLAGATTPKPLLEAVRGAGWSNLRLERLRDVEWARRKAAGPVFGWLEHVPRFAVVADAEETG